MNSIGTDSRDKHTLEKLRIIEEERRRVREEMLLRAGRPAKPSSVRD